MADPWWQSWLVPDRPGIRQFALVAVALGAPLPAVMIGPEWVMPALAGGVILGLGLGVGWGVLYARAWLRAAPVTTLTIFACALLCLLHVEVLPRWDLLLRLRQAQADFTRYATEVASIPDTPLPIYVRGPDQVRAAAGDARIAAWTHVPFRRWSPLGWQDRIWLVQPRQGETVICWNHAELDQALGRSLPALPPSGSPEVRKSGSPDREGNSEEPDHLPTEEVAP